MIEQEYTTDHPSSSAGRASSDSDSCSVPGKGLHSALSDRSSFDTSVDKHNSAISTELANVSVPRLLADIGIHNSSTGVGALPYPHFLKALHFLRSVLEVCFDSFSQFHTLPLKSLLSPLQTMQEWRLEDLEKNFKYVLCYPLAYLNNSNELSELPETPPDFKIGLSASLLFRGRALQFLKSRLCGRRGFLAYRFANSMLQGAKRACDTVSTYFQVNTMLKHRAVLSKEPACSRDFDEFDKFVNERLRLPKICTRSTLREISTSACFTNPVKDGGAREEVRKQLKEPSCLLKMDYSPNSGVFEVHTKIPPRKFPDLIRELCPNDCIIDMSASEGSIVQPCQCKVAAVLEPLKCRLITAGDSNRYYLSRGYQKDLWVAINKFPQFIATSRPINSFDIYAMLAREKKFPNFSFELFNSGDFSAATDNTNMNYTRSVFEFCLSRSSFENLDALSAHFYKNILRKVLYSHEIHYPLDRKRVDALRNEFLDEMSSYGYEHSPKINNCLAIFDQASILFEPFLQRNGQLMGSTLSFPILCLINLIQYWRSFEKFLGVEVEMNDLPVLINGDDILFRTNVSHYKIWKEFASSAGFSLSIGKNYTHKNFFCINSQSYWYNGTEVKDIPYFNVGLLMGMSKGNNKKGGISAFSGLSLDAMYNEMIKGCQNPLRASKRFCHYNREHIKKITSNGLFNLYLPRCLGGCGFQPPASLEYNVTDFQHAVCLDSFEKLDHIRGFKPSVHSEADPLIKAERETVPAKKKGCKTWKIAPFGPLEEGQEEVSSPIYSIWETISTACPVDFEITRNFKVISTIKKLAKLYRSYRANGGKHLRSGIRDRYYNLRLVSESRRKAELVPETVGCVSQYGINSIDQRIFKFIKDWKSIHLFGSG